MEKILPILLDGRVMLASVLFGVWTYLNYLIILIVVRYYRDKKKSKNKKNDSGEN